MRKKYYWLQLRLDFFANIAMKKLQRMPNGDKCTLIYIKLLLLSLKDNGEIYYEGVEPTFYEEMALALDEESESVKKTLAFLEANGLMEYTGDNIYTLTDIPNLIGSEGDSAERMRNLRRKKASQCDGNVTEGDGNVTESDGHVMKMCENVRKSDTEIEIDIEKDKEKETDCEHIVRMFNETCVSFPKVAKLSLDRKKAIKARLKQYSLEDFKKVFEIAEGSNFLKGGNNRNWTATFDWLIADRNMAKVLDGNYNNRGSTQMVERGMSEQEIKDLETMLLRS